MAYLEYKPVSTLFHYTSYSGFLGIIQSKAIWLSDVTKSNDPREIQLGRRLIDEAMSSDALTAEDRHLIRELMSSVDFYRRETRIYACSFAHDADSLPMWREYGDSCRGIAVGFRPTSMDAVPARLQLVRYVEDDISTYLASSLMELTRDMGRPRTIERALATAEALCIMTAIKHRSWKYEREVRLVHSQRISKPNALTSPTMFIGVHSDGPMVEWTEPLTRMVDGSEIHYKSLDFGRRRRDVVDYARAIEVVYIGPLCEYPITHITNELTQMGFVDFTVLRSECEIQ